jgi:hypothetical protein
MPATSTEREANVLPFQRREPAHDAHEWTSRLFAVAVGTHRVLVDVERLVSAHDGIDATWMTGEPAWAVWMSGPFGVVPAIDLRRRFLERDAKWTAPREQAAAITLAWDWRRVGLVVDRPLGEMLVDQRALLATRPSDSYPVRARCVQRGGVVAMLDLDGLFGHPQARRALARPTPPDAF